MPVRIQVDRQQIADFCSRHHIRKLSLFGSVLTDNFGPDSDVDVLVELEPTARVSLLGLAGMELELCELLGREVDLRTAEDLSRYFRESVIRTSELLYAA